MKTVFPFTSIITYIPSYHERLEDWQLRNRQLLYDFMKRIVTEQYRQRIAQVILKTPKNLPMRK